MRDFIVVPFEEWHFDAIELDGPEQKMIKNYGKSWADLVKCFKYVGATFSWYQDKKIIGICGVMPHWNVVG